MRTKTPKKPMSKRRLAYTILDMRFRQSMNFHEIALTLKIDLEQAASLNKAYVDEYVSMINANYPRIKFAC